MNFKDNPFYILKVNFYDDKATILQKADEAIFEVDESLIQSAVKDLTNTKRRLFWELRWFLCVASVNMEKIYSLIKENKALNVFTKQDSNLYLASAESTDLIKRETRTIGYDVAEKLTTINTYTFYIENHDRIAILESDNILLQVTEDFDEEAYRHNDRVSNLAQAIHTVADSLEGISIDEVVELINACRNFAFLPASSREDVVDAFHGYINEIKTTLHNAISNKEKDGSFLKAIIRQDADYMKYSDLEDLFSSCKEIANNLMLDSLNKMTNSLNLAKKNTGYNSNYYLTIIQEFPKFIDLAICLTKNDREEYQVVEKIILGIRSYGIQLANEWNKYKESKKLLQMLERYCPNDFSSTKTKLSKDCKDIENLITNYDDMLLARATKAIEQTKKSNSSQPSYQNASSKKDNSAIGLIMLVGFILFMLVLCTNC